MALGPSDPYDGSLRVILYFRGTPVMKYNLVVSSFLRVTWAQNFYVEWLINDCWWANGSHGPGCPVGTTLYCRKKITCHISPVLYSLLHIQYARNIY